ncbi:MAG: nitrous oxide-stimulated promoter family protein, partial [Atopobium sp.]|nr:nitrous oxide-stimulated promoter family protein [Atopobium sp.]
TRVDRCPHIETKTFCSKCISHCYNKEMRARVKEVMKSSGPRLLLHHPILVIKHALQ